MSSFAFAAGLGLDDEDPDDDDVFEPVTEAPKKVVKSSVKRRSQSLSALKDKEENKALRKVGWCCWKSCIQNKQTTTTTTTKGGGGGGEKKTTTKHCGKFH